MRHLFDRPVLAYLLMVCLSATFGLPCSAKDPSKTKTDSPNIVVFLVDDLGYMDIGANNPESFYETPFIDGLAKTGMRFTDG